MKQLPPPDYVLMYSSMPVRNCVMLNLYSAATIAAFVALELGRKF